MVDMKLRVQSRIDHDRIVMLLPQMFESMNRSAIFAMWEVETKVEKEDTSTHTRIRCRLLLCNSVSCPCGSCDLVHALGLVLEL